MTGRRTKSDMSAMEASVSTLIETLRGLGRPEHLDLAGRLWRCWRQRQERRDGLRDRVDRPCRSVACPHCRRGRGRQWRERAAEQMRAAEADPAYTSSVTILLAQTGTLPAVRGVIEQLRDNLRALRDRRAKKDRRWRSVAVTGIVEIDLLEPFDLAILPPQRREAVGSLPVIDRSDDMICVPHLHCVVSHPGIPREVLRDELSAAWPGPRRVDVKELRSDDVEQETKGVIGYAVKSTMKNSYRDRVTLPVCMTKQAMFWGWLHGLRSGIAPLRVRIAPMRQKVVVADEVVDDGEEAVSFVDIEPMPALFGGWW